MEKQINLYIYDKNLNFIGVMDDFISLRWRRKYFESGEFEINLFYDETIKRYLQEDNIIVREDDLEAGIIESWQINDDGNNVKLKILGRFLTSILERRIVKNTINFKGKYLEGEREVLKQMTPFSMLEIKPTDLDSEKIIFQCTYKNVYSYLNKLSKSSNIAHRIVVDIPNKKFIYENYEGLNRTETQNINVRFEFSEDRLNINTSKYTYSSKKEKNFILVGGSGEGTERIMVTVQHGIHNDLELKEMFLNSFQTKKEENMSDTDYLQLLKNLGSEKISTSIETFELKAFADDYKKFWNLGDVVNVKKESWEIYLKKRITEIEEVIERNKRDVFVTLGNPLAETFVEDERD